jgi:hypothetical protein
MACAAALSMSVGASAQDRRAPRPDPADPRAAAAALEHRSALSAYRRVGGEDPPPLAWRDANDTVARIGGWRAYAREAQGGLRRCARIRARRSRAGSRAVRPAGRRCRATSGARRAQGARAMRRRSVKASLPILVLAAGLAGCATLEPDAALAPVKAAATAHLGGKSVTLPSGTDDDATVDARVAELLRAPLDSDAALQVALLNHRGLRASLHDIGMADALRVQDSSLPNPGFSFGRFKSGDESEIDRSLHFSLARVIALPWLRDAAQQRLKATQSAVALKVVQHGMDTRRAWVRAVAARENLRYAQQVMRAAEAGADLARRMQARLGDRLRAAAVRLGRRPHARPRASTCSPCTAAAGDRDQRALRGARGLRRLPPAYDIARPRRDRAAEAAHRRRELLRYNGMLIGVFELLADARSQIASVNASIEALRDFWLARPTSTWPSSASPCSTPTASAGPAAAEAGAGH